MIQALYILVCVIPAAFIAVQLFVNPSANPVEFMLHNSGIWALNFLLLTLSVTPIRKYVKFRYNWIRLRRTLGLSAFFYALTHFAIFIVFEIELDIFRIPEEIIERRYIMVGFVALCVLVPLAITSTNRWQRRLKRNWLKLHKGVYVATLLAVLHYYMQVKADYFYPLVYGTLFAFLMTFRISGKTWFRRAVHFSKNDQGRSD